MWGGRQPPPRKWGGLGGRGCAPPEHIKSLTPRLLTPGLQALGSTIQYSYSIMISRCAARITRHRAFSSGTLQLSILIFMFFKPVCEGALQTRVQKASSFSVDFPRFCEVKIMIFRYFRGSGQPVFSILRISENFLYFSDFGDLAAAKKYSLFAQKSRLGLTFRGLVLYCFWCARVFNLL